MQIGDLVRQKVAPQGIWLVTQIAPDGRWFVGNGHEMTNVWRSVNEYEVMSESR